MQQLMQAYLLHRRNFRDSSLIIEFFTLEQGLISVVAKGARNPKSKLHYALQYFTPLVIGSYGKSELLGLKSAEINGRMMMLSGNYLLSMLYVNELLSKLLGKFQAHTKIYDAYEQLIQQLAQQETIEKYLRLFEMKVLEELGYGLSLNDLDETQTYSFNLEDGFTVIHQNDDTTMQLPSYSGKSLSQIQQLAFDDPLVLATAKALFRKIFTLLLHNKTLNSRQLFVFTGGVHEK